MRNSVDPDETAHYGLSHLDLCCLQKPITIAYGSERDNNYGVAIARRLSTAKPRQICYCQTSVNSKISAKLLFVRRIFWNIMYKAKHGIMTVDYLQSLLLSQFVWAWTHQKYILIKRKCGHLIHCLENNFFFAISLSTLIQIGRRKKNN